MNRYNEFIFTGYTFDKAESKAVFNYSFDNERWFKETVYFERADDYDQALLNRALFIAYIAAGVSYYKCYPTMTIRLRRGSFSNDEALFFNAMYREGLSQFVYENNLTPEMIAVFKGDHSKRPLHYKGEGTLVLQSGGKDSLLLAELLKGEGHDFTALYMRQSGAYPTVIDSIGVPVRTFERVIDKAALAQARDEGALNGHVPVTYIVLAYALIDAILHNESTILAAIGQEGEEPHAYIGDYAVRHQWAKTWKAEQLFTEFVHRSLSTGINVGSPLRGFSELKIAKLFSEQAWGKYGSSFSSCNVANYTQGKDNTQLAWCANCPKCANSFLLFAAFINPDQLIPIFGKDMFDDRSLVDTFKGLLGIDGFIKPFECIAEVSELRYAYQLSQANGYQSLPFNIPRSDFDQDAVGPFQLWAAQMISKE